jgi:hypothetical protein
MPGRMTDKELLDLAVQLVGLASAEILEVQQAGFTVDEKSDLSPPGCGRRSRIFR